MVKLFLKNSNLCDHNSPTSQMDGRTDRRTDRQTTCDRNTALCTKVHRAVKISSFEQILNAVSFALSAMSFIRGPRWDLSATREILWWRWPTGDKRVQSFGSMD